MRVMLVLGCVCGSKAAAAEPAPKKPAFHHHRTTTPATRAKATADAEPVFEKAPPPPRDEARVMLDLLNRIHGEIEGQVDDTTLMAMAQHAVEKRVHARFAQLDKNRDGRVSRVEVAKMPALRFSRFDLNGDAFITAEELGQVMRARCAERVQHIVARFDVNRDGRVTRAEVTPEPARDQRLAHLVRQPEKAPPLVTEKR